MLSQTSVILLTRILPVDSHWSQLMKSFFNDTIDTVFVLNQTIERENDLNVIRLGFVLVLISFVQMHGAVVVT